MDTTEDLGSAVKGKKLVRLSFKARGGSFVLRDHTRNGRPWTFKDRNGNPGVYTMKDTTYLDENDPFEAAVIEGFRNHPLYSEHIIVTSLEEEAVDAVDEFDLMMEAGDIVKSLGEMTKSFCRVLGMNTTNLSDMQLRKELVKIAKDAPSKIVNAKDDPMFTRKVILFDGQAANIFKRSNGVWYYRERPMGNDTDQAMQWMDKNEDLLSGIRKEIAKTLNQ